MICFYLDMRKEGGGSAHEEDFYFASRSGSSRATGRRSEIFWEEKFKTSERVANPLHGGTGLAN